MNRVGDMMLSIGLFSMFALFGDLNYATVFSSSPYVNEVAITIVVILLFIGATAKSAQVPLHVWLPSSMEGSCSCSWASSSHDKIYLFVLKYKGGRHISIVLLIINSSTEYASIFFISLNTFTLQNIVTFVDYKIIKFKSYSSNKCLHVKASEHALGVAFQNFEYFLLTNRLMNTPTDLLYSYERSFDIKNCGSNISKFSIFNGYNLSGASGSSVSFSTPLLLHSRRVLSNFRLKNLNRGLCTISKDVKNIP